MTTLAPILGAIVSLFTICATILGVGWKLGQIASGIRLEIAEIKGILAVSAERISQIERRVERLEKIQGDTDA
jgi:hypothetical protein